MKWDTAWDTRPGEEYSSRFKGTPFVQKRGTRSSLQDPSPPPPHPRLPLLSSTGGSACAMAVVGRQRRGRLGEGGDVQAHRGGGHWARASAGDG